jgi:hypothetical protein
MVPSKYNLKPHSITAVQFRGQLVEGLCYDSECTLAFNHTPKPLTHIHREYGYTPVSHGNWIAEEEGKPGKFVMSDEQFLATYEPAEE